MITKDQAADLAEKGYSVSVEEPTATQKAKREGPTVTLLYEDAELQRLPLAPRQLGAGTSSMSAGLGGESPSGAFLVSTFPLSEHELSQQISDNAAAAQFATTLTAAPEGERAKYERMWSFEQYRRCAPGESAASHFLKVARPRPDTRIIDFGTGTGRGAMMLALLGRMKVDMVDFAANCLDTEVRAMLVSQSHALKFFQADLATSLPEELPAAEFGFCTDVMEHIPEEQVSAVLSNILKKAQHCYFQISTTDDSCGRLIGEKLHLSVHPAAWWLDQFRKLDAQVHYFAEEPDNVIAYVSAWATGQDVVDIGQLNVELETIRTNVRKNVSDGWQQVSPHLPNECEMMILGGGPSLNSQLEKIRFLREQGVKLVTLNGAYNWAIERGLKVSATVICDARAFNARFTHPVQEQTLYLVSSQCDPSALEGLPKERTWLWHTTAEDIQDILNELTPEKWFGVAGGCTVLTRAIPLLRMLGYSKFHLFGCDSCIEAVSPITGKGPMLHHAYSQPENDNQLVMDVLVGGRAFKCHPWMLAQAQEFISLIKFMGNLFDIQVHGGGLLSWILEHGSALDIEAESLTPSS
jgi:2-polyprenyl-3-methyl-5-hydroxy-6-metoxy-1,4-benzoquinol methylase